MKTKLLKLIFGAALLVTAVSASGKSLPSDVLGLRLQMSQKIVHERLGKLGRLEREERGRQEVWTLLNEPHFASLIVGYDRDYKVRYVTAIARKGGSPMRYSDVAPLKDAYAENTVATYRYTWEVKPSRKNPGHFLILTGRDPQYLTSLSIKERKLRKSGSKEEDDQ